MQIGIEDNIVTNGEIRTYGVKISVLANDIETKIIARHIDYIKSIGIAIMEELASHDSNVIKKQTKV
jgi:hypothetical protein